MVLSPEHYKEELRTYAAPIEEAVHMLLPEVHAVITGKSRQRQKGAVAVRSAVGYQQTNLWRRQL